MAGTPRWPGALSAADTARRADAPVYRHREDGPLAVDTALALLPARHGIALSCHCLVLFHRTNAFSTARLGKGGACMRFGRRNIWIGTE
jgi:hypothetical protein